MATKPTLTMALVYNKKTGQIREVPDEQIGQQPQGQPTLAPLMQPQQQGKYITGRSLEEHQMALQRARETGNTAAAKQIESDFDKEYQYQTDIGGIQSMEQSEKERGLQQSRKEALGDLDRFEADYNETGLKGKLLGLLPGGTGLSPEAEDFDSQRDVLAYSLAEAIAKQEGRGLSDKDVENWLKILPHRSDNTQEASLKMENIRQKIADRLGVEPTAPTIKQEPGAVGRITEGIGNVFNAATTGLAEGINASLQQDPLKNPLVDLLGQGQTAQGNQILKLLGLRASDGGDVVNLPTMASGQLPSINPTTQFEGPVGTGKTIVEEPVESALAALPFLGKAKLPGRGKMGGGTPKVPAVEKAATAVSGGGSKEFIARGVGKETHVPQQQALMERGILAKPTTTGKIQATQEAINDWAKRLDTEYSTAQAQFTVDDIKGYVTEKLGKQYDPRLFDQVLKELGRQGNFDIATGTTSLTPKQLWEGVKGLSDWKPAPIKNMAGGSEYLKQAGNDITRAAREFLYEAVPEVRNSNAYFSAYRDYMDNVLKDPKGLNTNGQGPVGVVVGGAKNFVINPALQKIFDVTKGRGSQAQSVQPTAQSLNELLGIDADVLPKQRVKGSVGKPDGGEKVSLPKRTIKRDQRTRTGNFQPRATR